MRQHWRIILSVQAAIAAFVVVSVCECRGLMSCWTVFRLWGEARLRVNPITWGVLWAN